jgi:hypothetical protein
LGVKRIDMFNPIYEVENSNCILDGGSWPTFHDAEIINIDFWRGDVRPDDDVWTGPVIKIKVELCALESPYVVNLEFRDCSSIFMHELSHQNYVLDLKFNLEDRGTFTSGKPLPPWICVDFTTDHESRLKFKCFSVAAISREPA